jgi:RsiW-degrading membrane proteinase PrsW (M82 family)
LEICIFSLIYCALFHLLIFLICPSPSLAWILPAVAVSVILTTDVFHLGRHFAFYQLCLEQQPEWCYLFKFLIGFVLPFTVLRMIS